MIAADGCGVGDEVGADDLERDAECYSSIGNLNFEVDQLNCGASYGNIPNGAFACDRWRAIAGTMRFSTQQTVATPSIVMPGTN